jgi:hypothetical protein
VAQLRAMGQSGELERGDLGTAADRKHSYTLHDPNPAPDTDEITPGSKQ